MASAHAGFSEWKFSMKATRSGVPAKRRRNSASGSWAADQAKLSAPFPPRTGSGAGLGWLEVGGVGAEGGAGFGEAGFDFEDEGFPSVSVMGGVGIDGAGGGGLGAGAAGAGGGV